MISLNSLSDTDKEYAVTLYENILHYIYLKGIRLDNEVINHANYMQGVRMPDASDYLESIILTVQRDTFWEIANDLYVLLKMIR